VEGASLADDQRLMRLRGRGERARGARARRASRRPNDSACMRAARRFIMRGSQCPAVAAVVGAAEVLLEAGQSFGRGRCDAQGAIASAALEAAKPVGTAGS